MSCSHAIRCCTSTGTLIIPEERRNERVIGRVVCVVRASASRGKVRGTEISRALCESLEGIESQAGGRGRKDHARYRARARNIALNRLTRPRAREREKQSEKSSNREEEKSSSRGTERKTEDFRVPLRSLRSPSTTRNR